MQSHECLNGMLGALETKISTHIRQSATILQVMAIYVCNKLS
jgi:hypothetical protein